MLSYIITRENPDAEVVYFRNAFENAVLRQVKGDAIYVKLKGKQEFKARDGSGVVDGADMRVPIDYISKEVYDNW